MGVDRQFVDSVSRVLIVRLVFLRGPRVKQTLGDQVFSLVWVQIQLPLKRFVQSVLSSLQN